MKMPHVIDVYPHQDEPWLGVLVKDVRSVTEARRAAERESASGLPLRYLGIKTAPVMNEMERPGRRRRFHVFTDEPE